MGSLVREWVGSQQFPAATREKLGEFFGKLKPKDINTMTVLVLGKGGVGKSFTDNSLSAYMSSVSVLSSFDGSAENNGVNGTLTLEEKLELVDGSTDVVQDLPDGDGEQKQQGLDGVQEADGTQAKSNDAFSAFEILKKMIRSGVEIKQLYFKYSQLLYFILKIPNGVH
ncbi:hypothetical protein EUTSA_v10017808mg [Eutrema salsugineum]|uniref:AIG1-type G domain-containing protein n=1 Tax=Eutrema salsugineum TaxID=72664 RepID=V4M8K4_EUTSA|nr:hypothetical protein EUTSA_v10017808mg [Eutrema salsugineum]